MCDSWPWLRGGEKIDPFGFDGADLTTTGSCLVTVATDAYLPGTLVALSSFLAHNPWFDGDIKVIGTDLSDTSQELVHCICPAAEFVSVSCELSARIDDVVRVRPQFEPIRARFHALEAFGLTGYRKMLFVDSDLLFRGSVEPMLVLDQPLIACADRAWFGEARRPWLPEDGASQSFNAGLMIVDMDVLGKETYRQLLAHVNAETYSDPAIRHADQYVLNALLGRQVTIADSSFNYLLGHLQVMQDYVPAGLADATVLHFNGPMKPWRAEQVLAASKRRPELVVAFRYWYAAWTDCLTRIALKNICGAKE